MILLASGNATMMNSNVNVRRRYFNKNYPEISVKSQIESPQDEHRQVENITMSLKQCLV